MVQRSGSSPAASQSSSTSIEFSLMLRGVGVVGGQRVPVGDEEEAIVLVLQLDPVIQRAHEVSQVQLAGGAHAAQDPRFLGGAVGHQIPERR